MIRTLFIIIALFAIAFGFVWLKDTPGELALTVGDTVYSIGLAQAVLLFVIVCVVSIIIYLVLRLVWIAPGRALFAWRDRRTEQGRAAISRGLLAIAAGDLRQAEMASKEAAKRAPDAPLTALLQAQAAQLKGDQKSAGTAFTAMLDNPATRIAGLHGLFVEAERQGATEAARHYAETAYEARPDTAWAVRALLRFQAGEGNWDAALLTLASAGSTRAIDKKLIRGHRAVLLTAKAMAGEDTDKAAARQAALEAHQLKPDLAAAAIVAGRILSRAGEVGRAAKVLEAAWKAAPHPEIADAYAHVRSGDSARDRMDRMEKLMRMRPHHDEGRMAYAAAAIEAREFDAARDTLKPIIATRPTRNALILMAELDEAEHGDRGRVREWLDRAVRAPLDPVWTADGLILDEWAPVSPVTGRIGAVEWKLPVDEGESRLSIDVDDDAFKPREVLPIAAAAPVAAAAAAEAGAPDVPDEPDGPDEDNLVDVTPAAQAAEDKPLPPEPEDKPEVRTEKAGLNGEDPGASVDHPLAPKADETPVPTKRRRTSPRRLRRMSRTRKSRHPARSRPRTIPSIHHRPQPRPTQPTLRQNRTVSMRPPRRTKRPARPATAMAATAADAVTEAPGRKRTTTDAAAPDAGAEDDAGTKDGEAGDAEDEGPKLPHLPPDDPGVDETQEPEPRGFRLF